jgi:alpha-beta hydrolase superfamily lysophospholipase
MHETTGTHETRDGLTLRTRTWSADEPTRAMLIHHGLGEHSGRWRHVGRFFADRGYAVAAFDMRGHGESEGTRAYVGSFSDFLDDVEDLARSDLVRADVPWVLYGHSLGGLICTLYLADDRPQPDAAVLSAPALTDELPKTLRFASRLLSKVAPKLEINNSIRGDQLSRDEAVGEAYFADPLVLTKGTPGLAVAAFGAQHRSREAIPRITTPTLVIHGGGDTLVSPAASAPLAAAPAVDRKVYPGLRHEIHNEPERAQVLGDVAGWLDARLA